MYQTFNIIGVEPDFVKNQIVVQASVDIDKDSVNDSTVELFSKNDGAYVNTTFDIKDKTIIITIKNTIVLDSEYILRITKIKNVLGEIMPAGIRRKVVFTTDIKSIPTVLSPTDYEVIEDLNISLDVDGKSSITSLKDNFYFIQIASDVAFIDIELETIAREDKVLLKNLKSGQHFIRSRITDNKQSGLWSKTETFILKEKPKQDDECNCSVSKPNYIEYVSVVSYPENGQTPADIVIEFDGEVDASSLVEMMVIRRDI